LKYEKNANGEVPEDKMYQMLAVLFSCVFRNTEPYLGWALRRQAKIASDEINSKIKANLERLQTPPIAGPIFLGIQAALQAATGQTRPSDKFHKDLLASKKAINDLVAMVLGLAVGSSVNQAQAISQMVDLYTDGHHNKELEHIIQLVSKTDAESTQLLVGYYREAARLNPQFPALVRIAATQDNIPQPGDKPPVSVKPGDRLFCSYRNAHLDPELFPNPETIDPRRSKENYAIQAIGTHGCPGLNFSEQAIPAIMREIFSLKNLRRAPGVLGTLEGFDSSLLGTKIRSYVDENGCISPWPTSLVFVYDS